MLNWTFYVEVPFSEALGRKCEQFGNLNTVNSSPLEQHNNHTKDAYPCTSQRRQRKMDETMKDLENNQWYGEPKLRFEKKWLFSRNDAEEKSNYVQRAILGSRWSKIK